MQVTRAQHIIDAWPSRQAVLEDARAARADLDLFAVHRWYQRSSIPSRYWAALVSGAQQRGIDVSVDDFLAAHAHRGAA